MAAMSVPAIRDYLIAEFPQVFGDGAISVVSAEDGEARLALTPGRAHLRPGKILSGPAIMSLADAAAYAALLSLDDRAKMAVTSDLTIHFLRGGSPDGRVFQDATVIKSGRRLSVITCRTSSQDERLLAHATMSYAMPLA
ncbi:MAG: PaaI family thioesterase [Pseudomonadota bacterium]